MKFDVRKKMNARLEKQIRQNKSVALLDALQTA